MKTTLKVIKTIAKVYGIFTIGLWFFIGTGELAKEFTIHPGKSVLDADNTVFHRAVDNWVNYFKD